MLTRDDIKVAQTTCDTLYANLALLNEVAHKHIKEHSHDHDDNSQQASKPLVGLIGTTKSHIKTLLTFPADSADEFEKSYNHSERQSVINIGLPYSIEKLPALIDAFKPYLTDEDATKLCDTIKTNLTQLAGDIAEIKKNPKLNESSNDKAPLTPR